jgi:predicted metal-dependent enzyme (double-stranded beta helix superfamily)
MFDLDRFFADCQDAVAQDASHKGVREVVARAVSEPDAVIAALGEPQRAGINVLYRSPIVTILNLVWGPGMTVMPHDHRMWAVIGIYTGREDNIFWRRLPPDADRGIEAATARRWAPTSSTR